MGGNKEDWLTSQWLTLKKTGIKVEKYKNIAVNTMFPGYPHVRPGNTILSSATNLLVQLRKNTWYCIYKCKNIWRYKARDEEFLQHVSAHKPSDIHYWFIKQIAYSGIAIKYNIEQITGLIYPQLPNSYKKQLLEYIITTTSILKYIHAKNYIKK